jgi:hypothetical protein
MSIISVPKENFIQIKAAGKLFTIYGTGEHKVDELEDGNLYSQSYELENKLNVSVRIYNLLGSNGITNYGLLKDSITSGQIFRFRGMGGKSLLELFIAIKATYNEFVVPHNKRLIAATITPKIISQYARLYLRKHKVDKDSFFKAYWLDQI